MRERVLMALRDAAAGTPVDASHAHDLVTRLALRHWRRTPGTDGSSPRTTAAHADDRRAGGGARAAAPLASAGTLGHSSPTMPLYVAAARETLAGAAPRIRRAPRAADNDADAAVALRYLLARRDQ
jgi:hypothetical protein